MSEQVFSLHITGTSLWFQECPSAMEYPIILLKKTFSYLFRSNNLIYISSNGKLRTLELMTHLTSEIAGI